MVAFFVDDDPGYLAWLVAHPDGFVLNTYAHLSAGYLVLHQAGCRTINRELARGKSWTAQYGKACADTVAQLVSWAAHETTGTPHACGTCQPPLGAVPPPGPLQRRAGGGRRPDVSTLEPIEARYAGPAIGLIVERHDGGPRLVLESVERLALEFFRRDPSARETPAGEPPSYDVWARRTPRDRLVRDDVAAINRTMAARNKYASWGSLLVGTRPQAWLTALGTEWDLVEMTDADWESAHVTERLAAALAEMLGTGRDLSVATKVLHLKRPRLVPVCDSLVLAQVGIRGADPIAPIMWLRRIGRENVEALRAIDGVLRLFMIERSLVRILDAVLWATHPSSALAKTLTGWEIVLRPHGE